MEIITLMVQLWSWLRPLKKADCGLLVKMSEICLQEDVCWDLTVNHNALFMYSDH